MSGRRRAAGWVPNQHGAWAMLASPILLGALACGPSWRHVPLALFWFAGYFAFFATSLWLKSGRRARYLPPVRAYALLATALGALTATTSPGLLRWAPGFVLPLAVGLWAAARRHERELLAGLATVVGSALMTVVAYDVGGGEDLRRAGLLTLGQFLYFGGTVCYVKSMIRERGNPRYLALSIGWHALAVVAMVGFSPWLAVVLGVLAVRAAVVPRYALTPAQIGIGEIGSTVAVGVVSLLTL